MKLLKPKFDPPELLGLNKSLWTKTGHIRYYLYQNWVHLDQNKTDSAIVGTTEFLLKEVQKNIKYIRALYQIRILRQKIFFNYC